VTTENTRKPWNMLPLTFVCIALLGFQIAVTHGHYSSSDLPPSFTSPTGSNVHTGTIKTFNHDGDLWYEERWDFSPIDNSKRNPDPSVQAAACAHIRKWKYFQTQGKPYEAIVYENMSMTHYYATLKEAESFVEQWCKP